MTLVVGGTGLLGMEVCRRLRSRAIPVRALVRKGSAGEAALRGLGVEIVQGDLRDGDSLAAACQGVSAIVSTANSVLTRGAGDTFETVDRDGHLALIEAARVAGVGRFVFVSVSPGLPADNPFVRAKRVVEAALQTSGLAWTILQPSAFMQIHCGPTLGWDFTAGKARILGSPTAPRSYVSVTDVADLAVEASVNPLAANRHLRIVGPEPLSAADAVRVVERVIGRPVRVQRMPTGVLRVLGKLLRPFAPVPSALMAMTAAAESGEVEDMAGLQREFSLRLQTFEEYVRLSLTAAPGPRMQ